MYSQTTWWPTAHNSYSYVTWNDTVNEGCIGKEMLRAVGPIPVFAYNITKDLSQSSSLPGRHLKSEYAKYDAQINSRLRPLPSVLLPICNNCRDVKHMITNTNRVEWSNPLSRVCESKFPSLLHSE
jgi:hypothetical protein